MCGALELKNNVFIYLEKDSTLLGSVDHNDYGNGGWGEALLTGYNAKSIGIIGEGLIDGADCINPNGEEGFRGPHAVFLTQCNNITIKGITISNAGNYAILCRNVTGAIIENVNIRGGHDGIHAQSSDGFYIKGCDLRTGDDSVAGCDNKNFEFLDCQFNSSCNGFRFGGEKVTVKKCRFWGPGEYVHKISGRRNMGTAFVHFSPTDRNPKILSDNWLVQDITLENVDTLYEYNYVDGLWQTGQPVKNIKFENVKAEGLTAPFMVIGDDNKQFNLTLNNVELHLHKDNQNQELLNIRGFNSIKLNDVTLENDGNMPVAIIGEGKKVIISNVNFNPETNENPFFINDVDKIEKN